MLTDFCPACPFDITVIDVYSSVISINIKNLTEMPLKLFVPLSFYRSDDDLEIDQKYWFEGLSGIEEAEGLVIKPKTLKGGKASFISNLPEKGLWSINIVVPERKSQYFISYRYERCEPLHFPLISVEQKEYDLPKLLALAPSTGAIREVTSNVERLELIEDKFGIGISGVYASTQAMAEDQFLVRINFDISSSDGEPLKQSFYIHATAYNKAGQAIGMENIFVHQPDFFGFDSRSLLFYIDQPLEKIRLFPKK